MEAVDAKFVAFSFGMGAAIASSLLSMYILVTSLMGRQSLLYEQNPIIAIGEIFLLTLAVGTCIVSTEIYQRYQKTDSQCKKAEN